MLRLTRQKSREIDRIAIEQFHIPGIVLMENAARGAADVAGEMLGGVFDGLVLVLCGGGNNGGDGLAVARHLVNRGADVRIGLFVDPQSYSGDALTNWMIVQAMRIPADPIDPAKLPDHRPVLLIDAIFGTGLSKVPRDPFAQIVATVNSMCVPILAIDLPSGLDCDTGLPLGACIKASRTVTFFAEKAGFANPAARQYTGDVVVRDIGFLAPAANAGNGFRDEK